MSTTVTAAVIDTHALLRDRLACQLASTGQIRVIGEASTARDAMELLTSVKPDVAVVGGSLPEAEGVALVHGVRRERLTTRLLVLTRSQDDSLGVRLRRDGAWLHVPHDVDDLVETVLAIHARALSDGQGG